MVPLQTVGIRPPGAHATEKTETVSLTTVASLERGQNAQFDARVHQRLDDGDKVMLLLRDEGHFVLASADPDRVDPQTYRLARHITRESIVRVSGLLHSNSNETPEVEIAALVLRADAVHDLAEPTVLHECCAEQQSQHAAFKTLCLNERLNNRVADVKVAATGAVFKLLSGVFQLAVEHQTRHGFTWINTPALINYKLPGDDDYFPVSYFDHEDVYLAQTGEFHLQIALAMDMKRVFEIRNVFRREPRVSSRHLTEYTALEVMMGFEHDWREVLYSAESLLSFIVSSLQEKDEYQHLVSLAKKLHSSVGDFKIGTTTDGHCPALTFCEAKTLLREDLGFHSENAEDFTQEEEAALGRLMRSSSKRLSINGPPTDMFTITDWPSHLRPFNVHKSPESGQNTHSFDIILRGQETCSGWQSIHSHAMMRGAMLSRDPPIDPDAPMWRPYVQAYEAGSPPQGGYGIGLNRLLQNVLGLSDIHEAVLFPRNAQRLAP